MVGDELCEIHFLNDSFIECKLDQEIRAGRFLVCVKIINSGYSNNNITLTRDLVIHNVSRYEGIKNTLKIIFIIVLLIKTID